MIKDILKLLKSDPFLIGDPDIDIAKGKYEQPMTTKEVVMSIKRNK